MREWKELQTDYDYQNLPECNVPVLLYSLIRDQEHGRDLDLIITAKIVPDGKGGFLWSHDQGEWDIYAGDSWAPLHPFCRKG